MGKFDVITLETYDPKALGARCDECILKNAKGGPIPPEYHDKATAAIITDYPREKELATSRPLSGSHGMFLNDTLQSVGTRRTKVDLHHAIACMPPEADLDKVMLKWTRENKRRTKQGFDPVPSPLECCRPRLLNELDHQNLVTLGKTAYQSITGKNRPIHDIRGGPVDGGFDAVGNFLIASDPKLYARPLKVLPTLHPGFVQQSKRWSRAFKSDLSRAFRWFSGHLGWKEPRITLNPTPAQLDLFLRRQDVPFIFDVETTFDDPLVAKLKCVGISDEDHAMVVHFLSIEGPGGTLVGGPYTESDELEIRGILRDFFADGTRLKVGHNAGYFDRLVIKQHFGVDPQPLLDTILLHRSVESELPHKLGYVGSIYTDVTAWKEAHTASEARNDYELGVYCAVDCCVTARAMPKLYEAALLRGQDQVVQFDHKIQEVCVGLHEAGMFVDLEQRAKESARLTEEMKVFGEAARMASGNRDMNLNSTPQLRDLLYTQWLLAPVAYTKLGDPSTNDESLRLLRTANKTEERVCNFIDSLRRYRRASKEYGTYVKRLVPYNSFNDSSEQLDEDEDGEQSDVSQEMIAGKKKKRGMILGDGRVHPDYNAHGTTSGRLSSSNPNCFTGDTEILTPEGWVRFDQLPKGGRVAQYHDNRRIDWVVPTAYIEEEFDGELVHVQNQHIDLVTTPDHRCLLRNRKTGQLRVFKAEDYPSDWQQLHSGILLDWEEQKFPVSISSYLLMLIVAAQADGSWVQGTAHKRLTFKFTKQRKIDRLRKIIETLGHHVVVRIDRDAMNGGHKQRRIEIEGAAVDEVYQFIGEDKRFGPWLMRLPQDHVALFCDEVFYWDGCFTRKNHYSSNDRENASWVQTMLSLAGYRAKLRAYQGTKNVNWQVDVTRRDYSLTTNVEKTRVPYKGKVYCVSVPSSYILVRHNGCVMVTGQSQNWPKHLRGMIIPQPGNVLVGADADQLELRSIASVAGIARYLEIFEKGGDPHAETASLMFGKAFTSLVPKSDQWDKLRKIAKSIKYASFYGSGDETVHNLVTSAEDEKGNLMYPDLSLREVATLRRNWLKGIPELPKWWDDVLEEYRGNGFVADPVLGRRRDFLDGEEFNEIINFPIQSGSAHVIHMATFDLLQVMPFSKWGPGTGLIAQVHDALYAEVPCNHEQFSVPNGPNGKPDEKLREFGWCPPGCRCEANWAARQIEEAMNRTHPGFPDVTFSATAKIAKRWSKV